MMMSVGKLSGVMDLPSKQEAASSSQRLTDNVSASSKLEDVAPQKPRLKKKPSTKKAAALINIHMSWCLSTHRAQRIHSKRKLKKETAAPPSSSEDISHNVENPFAPTQNLENQL
jgi:hypothetical protein